MSESPDGPDRIEITTEDLERSEVDIRVSQLEAAAAPQVLRAVGAPPAGGVSGFQRFSGSSVVTLGIAGLVGGLAGGAITEVVTQPDASHHWFGEGMISTLMFIAVFALVLGAVFASWTGIQSRSIAKVGRELPRALPSILGGAIVGGFLAQKAYSPMFESAYRNAYDHANSQSEFDAMLTSAIHVPRGIAFAIVGAALGIGVGAARRAWRPVINGLVGGAVGGFIGGFTFDYVGGATNNGTMSRIVALTITGFLIGLSTGLVEAATKQHWLEIVSGGMAGKQFILYEQRVTVGSAPGCGITLIKDPTMAPEHLILVSSGTELEASPATPDLMVQVNGVPITRHKLGDSDLVQIGSTILRYRSKDEAMPTLAPSMK